MTITYPRSLPSNSRMSECWFDLQDNVSVNIVGRTLMNISQVLPPAWKGTFVTGLLEHVETAVWSGWRKSLLPARTFLAYDVRRSAPLAYPTAKASTDIKPGWNGTCSVTAIAAGGALSLAGLLPAFYKFKTGDRIGLEQGGKYGYYEVIEDVTATSLGVATVTVAPFLHTEIFDTSAVCRLWRPTCQFIMDQSTWSEPGTVEIGAVSFNGMQRL